jgi:hypothetical protein
MFKKKADPTDIVLLAIILFSLAVSLVTALYTNTIIQRVISTTALNQSTAYASINTSFDRVNTHTVQQGFVMMFGLLIIGNLVSAFLIRVHPVFIFVYITTLAVSLWVGVYMANTYAMLVANPLFADFAAKYTMITYMMQHSIKILLGVGALGMIIIFGKIAGGGVGSSSGGDFG